MRSRASQSIGLSSRLGNSVKSDEEKIHGKKVVVQARSFGYQRISLCVLVGLALTCTRWYSRSILATSVEKSIPDFTANENNGRRIESDCENYGCPIFPHEMDDVRDDIESIRTFRNKYPRKPPPVLPFGTMDMATLTRMSNRKPTGNQDAAIVLDPFPTLQTVSSSDFFIGIFDGHGRHGHFVARYASKELPYALARKFNEVSGIQDDAWIAQTLKDTFVEVDANAPPNAMLGGCTASVTLRRGNKLFIANVGDSRTLVVTVSSNAENVTYASRRDKPHLPDERARIEALNGTIHTPPNNPALSRVIVYSTAHVAYHEMIGLAMSLSIGDWEWGAVGVTAEPIVDVLNLETLLPQQSFVLAASDGLWDARRPQFFAKRFADCFYRGKNHHPLVTCLDTILAVSPKNESWYRDDITLVVKKLM